MLNLWDGGYPAVKSASLSLSCLHCAEPACVDACPADAIEKRASDGLVLVDPRGCIGCGACAQACPYGVPQFDAEGIMCKCDQCYDQNLAGTDLPLRRHLPGQSTGTERSDHGRKTGLRKSRSGDVGVRYCYFGEKMPPAAKEPFAKGSLESPKTLNLQGVQCSRTRYFS